MRDKENKNFKNKKNPKNLLIKNNLKSYNLQNINIQKFREDEFQNYLYEEKKYNKTKLPCNISNLNNSFTNINNETSPKKSLNSSSEKYIRKQKGDNHKYKRFKTNLSNSSSKQSKYLNYSSSSIKYSDYSDSSDFSYRSRENKRKNYKHLMMADEDDLVYLNKKDIGIVSSDDEEENNNSKDNSEEENYCNEIERLLIEIYNKNISLISSGNFYDINRKNNEIKKINKMITKYLKKKNFKTKLIILKCLSKNIKELIVKYKEKLLEIDEIKTIHNLYKTKIIQFNNQIYHNHNSLGNNNENNLNNSSDSISNDEEILFKDNNSLLNQDGIKILLRELINIKKTLKVSSKEIEGIFEFPLRVLKNEKGKKIKFSIKLMQIEEFCKTLLHDDFIYFLLMKIKESIKQIPNIDIQHLIDEVDKNCEHKNEMTRFINYINEKLENPNENSEYKEGENNYLEDQKIKGNSNNNRIIKNTNSPSSEHKEENNNYTNKKVKKKKKRKKKIK